MMKQHHRQSIRLPEYNYSTVGGCSITVCTYNRECLFGEIIDGKMNLNQCGGIVNDVWNDLPNHYHNVELDIHAIMPNHFHGIIHIIVGISRAGNSLILGRFSGLYFFWL